MNERCLVIICQAPADIPYVLTIYEQNNNNKNISIFVINVFGIYKFLNDLNLEVQSLVFIPYDLKSFKNIFLLIKEKIRIEKIWDCNFKNLADSDIYFFSKFEDWLTAFFVHKLYSNSKNNKIFYVNHYDNSEYLFFRNKSFSLKKYVYVTLLKYLTGVRFNVDIIEKMPEFPVKIYSFQEIKINVDYQIYEKYSISINHLKNIKSVIFFISPCQNEFYDPRYYNSTLIKIVEYLNKYGYKIVVKGHPRMGVPSFLDDFIDCKIPDYIPAEFINIRDFKFCFGLDTGALCYFSKNNLVVTYSLINMFVFSNQSRIRTGIEYLKQQSNNKVAFCNSFPELISILESVK